MFRDRLAAVAKRVFCASSPAFVYGDAHRILNQIDGELGIRTTGGYSVFPACNGAITRPSNVVGIRLAIIENHLRIITNPLNKGRYYFWLGQEGDTA